MHSDVAASLGDVLRRLYMVPTVMESHEKSLKKFFFWKVMEMLKIITSHEMLPAEKMFNKFELNYCME